MKLLLFAFLLGLVCGETPTFFTMRSLPVTLIDTSYLKAAKTQKHQSFAELTSNMKQLRDVSQVQTFLDNFLKDINDIRQQRIIIIQQVRAQCAEEDTFRKAEIAEGQRSAIASQNQLTLCSAQREQAGHLRDLAVGALEIYNKELRELDNARDVQRRTFAERLGKLQKLQAGLVEVSKLLDTFEIAANSIANSPQFIETTNEVFKHSVRTGHSSYLLPIYTKLIQMHSQKYDPADVALIRGLLDQLSANVATNIQTIINQDAEDEKNYQASRARLQALIAKLNSQVAFTQQFIADMDGCVSQETSISQLSKDKVTRNGELLNIAAKLCAASEEEWRLSELSRIKQVNVVNALKKAVVKIETDYSIQLSTKAAAN